MSGRKRSVWYVLLRRRFLFSAEIVFSPCFYVIPNLGHRAADICSVELYLSTFQVDLPSSQRCCFTLWDLNGSEQLKRDPRLRSEGVFFFFNLV